MTTVKILCDSPDGDYKEGDVGVVDGYIQNGRTYAVVIIGKRFNLVPIFYIEKVEE